MKKLGKCIIVQKNGEITMPETRLSKKEKKAFSQKVALKTLVVTSNLLDFWSIIPKRSFSSYKSILSVRTSYFRLPLAYKVRFKAFIFSVCRKVPMLSTMTQ